MRQATSQTRIPRPNLRLVASPQAQIPVLQDFVPRVAVFICSSDNRKDVLERVAPSLLKFWNDCPYPIYVGVNTPLSKWPKIRPVLAAPKGWRDECLDQVSQIKATHLIVILDDFLFQGPVDQIRLTALVSKATSSKMEYLRLMPLGKSLLERVKRTGTAEDIHAIEEDRPFYSCLQIALWTKEHFTSLLQGNGSIWDFEHEGKPGVPHYAITAPSPFTYRHIIEKGRWLPNAASLLQRAGLPNDLGSRPSWTRLMNFRLLYDHLKLFVLGYANH